MEKIESHVEQVECHNSIAGKQHAAVDEDLEAVQHVHLKTIVLLIVCVPVWVTLS
jgi:hypothetical protein